ncbi:MAG: hypothetical protein ACRD3T_20455 [Terriglobia bacterium]
MRHALLASIVAFSFGAMLHAQDVRIKVLNGRNGRPVTNERVNVWVGDKPAALGFGGKAGAQFFLPTGKDGVAVLHLGPVRPDLIEVLPDFYLACQRPRPVGSVPRYSIKEIITQGVATANTCGKIEVSPKPGELIFFVRPRTLWERLRQ